MDLPVPEFKHTASLASDWQNDFIKQLGCNMITDKQMNFPEKVATGGTYFMQISEYFSVQIIDLKLNNAIRFTRIPSDEDFWIVYYDMSDKFNRHFVDNVQHKIGYRSKLGFAIIDSSLQSTYISPVGERTYSLRLHIRKSFIRSYFREAILEKDFKNIFDDKTKKMFYYGHIDSRSKVELYNLKSQRMDNLNYDFLLKSCSFKLLAFLMERLNSHMPKPLLYLEKDLNALIKTKEYLLSNLSSPFPGIKVLAEIANMSISKYALMYNNVFGSTAVTFFRIEKLRLARELLESGKFKYISAIAYELGFSKTSYFTSVYKNYHGHLPSEVFKCESS